MSLSRYLYALRHYWFVAAAFLLAAAIGTWLYLRFNRGQTAVVTVAVLEPAVTNNINGEQAQVNFASVVESRTVSERVIRSLGLALSPEALQSDISVELSRTLIPSVASPLYSIEVRNTDGQLAVQLADAVVAEAGSFFQELNALDRGTLDSILRPQEEQLRADLAASHERLRAFEESHQAWLLPVLIEQQLEILRVLREPIGFAPVSEAVELELEATLSRARQELNELYVLLPEYERLSLDATLAIDRLLVMSDAKTLRDFTLRPSSAAREIETSLDDWEQARAALLDYLEQTEPIAEQQAAAGQSDDLQQAYELWTSARTALVRSIAAQANPEVPSDTSGEGTQAEEAILQAGLLDLPERLGTQLEYVRNVQFLLLTTQIETLGYEAALAAEEVKLRRLLELLPEYQALASQVAQVEIALNMASARKAALIYESSLPAETQIKVLDPAHIESNLLDTAIPIALSLAFSLSAVVVAVYLLAYFVHIPFTPDEIEEWLEVPVLASMPRVSSRRRRTP